MQPNVRLLSFAVAIAVLSGIVSCARLTLQEEPTAIPDPESTKGGFRDGFPDIYVPWTPLWTRS